MIVRWIVSCFIGTAEWFDAEDEIIITRAVKDIVIADKLNVLEYNICGDHMHILLVCEEEVPNIVKKATRGLIPLSTSKTKKGINPLVRLEGEKSVPVWTQKFGNSEIKDDVYLANAIEYIRNYQNRPRNRPIGL